MKSRIVAVVAWMLFAVQLTTANADIFGLLSTDRFGYTGTTTRYATLGDAMSASNPLNTINIGNRDAALYISDNIGVDPDADIIMGSWWYSTDPSGNPGWGNVNGNTGIGFLQLYDDNASARQSIYMGFTGYDGSFYRDFVVELSGENAGPSEFARFSPFASNVEDGGVYLSYDLQLVAGGLDGIVIGPNEVEATNHPTSVAGSFSGIFQNTSANPSKVGFYTFTLNFDMINWAWDNRDNLTYPVEGFSPSYFYGNVIPEPTSGLLMVLAFAAMGLRRRSR